MARLSILCLSVCAVLLIVFCGPAGLAAPPGPDPFRDSPECPPMVRLPAGSFQMGDASTASRPDERPVHTVTLPAFAAGQFEVTRQEFGAFVAATGYAPEPGCLTDRDQDGRWAYDASASWRDPGYPQTDRDPVVCVSWRDAQAYAAWLSRRTGKTYRLLSEAEWEYAVRAGGAGQFWWGDSPDELCAYANGPDLAAKAKFPAWKTAACDDGRVFTAPAGAYRANGFGLFDMAGNVWEWTQDCYAPDYGPQPRDGRAYETAGCPRRALRGGSWVYGLADLRSAQRNGLPPPTVRGGDIGFRVARSL